MSTSRRCAIDATADDQEESHETALLGATIRLDPGREQRSRSVLAAQQSGAAKQRATEQETENFKKAMSVCLEGKKYLVRY